MALGAGTVSAHVPGNAPAPAPGPAPAPAPAPAGEPGPAFQHSVASGDPLPDGVIIWTRVTPTPDAVPGSGAGAPTKVAWAVSPQADLADPVQSGEVTTNSDFDHTVKVDVRGLQPGTTYFYRFTVVDGPAAGQHSRIGRTRTAPALGTDPGRVRFGVCSCANYEAGYFRGYREMADRDDLEFVLHLGDYTYEYESKGYVGTYDTQVRTVQPANRTVSLADYRIRQGVYHQDKDLGDLHAAKPMICIWDDHEFADNSWREGAGGNSAKFFDNFPEIKANATRAYFEWMPVRTEGRDDDRHLYRYLNYGSLFEIIIPDLRSYRDYEVLQYGKQNFFKTDPDFLRAAGRDGRSMLGQNQFDWFKNVLTTSDAKWQIVGNEVLFAPMTLPDSLDPRVHDWMVHQLGLSPQGVPLNTDQWDGYMAERQKIVDAIVENNLGSVVFLTGDIHSSWANDIPQDPAAFRNGGNQRVVATEFVAPSISASSGFDSVASKREEEQLAAGLMDAGEAALQAIDPWFRWIDLRFHGYMAVEVTADRVQSDWIHSVDVLTPDVPLHHAMSFQTINGKPGVVPAPAELDRSQTIY